MWAIFFLAGQVVAQDVVQLEKRLLQASDRERSDLLVELSGLYRKTDPERAVELGTEALRLLERFPSPDRELRLANSLAHAFGSLSRYREALEHAQRAEALARVAKDSSALAFALSRAGYAHRKLGDTSVALEHYNDALHLYEQLGDRINLAFCLTGRCRIRSRTGDVESALADCLEAYEILVELGDRDEQTQALNDIGLIHDEKYQHEEARGYYKRALALQEESGNKILISRLLNNIGVSYHEQDDLEQALEYYSRSLKLKSEIGDSVGVSRRLVNIGNIYSELERFEESREKYQEALRAAHEIDFKTGIALASEGLALVDAQQGHPERALGRLREALAIRTEIGEPRWGLHLDMSRVYEALGRYPEALAAHQEFERLKSKILEEERDRNISEMWARFGAEQKGKEIQLLEQQQAISSLELKRQRSSRQALVVGFGLTLTVLLITFNRYRLKARAVAMEQVLERERTVNARLREVDRLKDEFLANTSHELRTPLYGISGLAESLISGATGELPVATQSQLGMIVASGRRLTALVDDLLDFSKLRHRSLELDLRSVDLHSSADVVLTLLRPLVGTKDLKLENTVATDLPPVLADENRLQQIFHNLVGNAIKFTETGEIAIAASVDDSGERIVVSVRDTGIGIPEEQQERIFEPFVQGDGAVEREVGGTGLGLAVTRQLLELHNSRLEMDSVESQGTTFRFALPIAVGEPLPEDSGPETPQTVIVSPLSLDEAFEEQPVDAFEQASTVRHSSTQLLVVDDEPVNRHVLVNQLTAEGYRVDQASSGAEALAWLEDNTADLILLDVMMPRMSGYEVCRQLRERFPPSELPVLFLTAKTQVSDLVVGLKAGANDYLAKPIAKSELLTRVETHLALRTVNRQLSELVTQRTAEVKERERLLVERQQLLDQLEARSADLARFNYSVAHDLKNPITTIHNFVGLARQDAARGEARLLEHDFDRLQIAANKLSQLLDDLFEFSQLSLQPISPEETDSGDLVRSALRALEDQIASCDAKIEVAPDLPRIRCDRSRCETLIRHLIQNALAYVDDGQSPEIEVGLQMESQEPVFYVRDRGMGIEARYHEKVFELFERLDPAGSEGTGIGLALAKRTVEAHGGRIWVESSGRGLGSTFKFMLPSA